METGVSERKDLLGPVLGRVGDKFYLDTYGYTNRNPKDLFMKSDKHLCVE